MLVMLAEANVISNDMMAQNTERGKITERGILYSLFAQFGGIIQEKNAAKISTLQR